MNPTLPHLILSAEGFTVRPDLAALAEIKAAKLRRHRLSALGHVRVHVRRVTPHATTTQFEVCITAESPGPDFVVHAVGAEPEIGLNAAFAKLERAITASVGVLKHERHRDLGDAKLAAGE